jgi:phosphonopyruvate decarboxylase
MGHSSSIALGLAVNKPEKRFWCIDGDGAALMHMGAMAVIGATHPNNLVHIVINNEAHESVGGLPTVAGKVDLSAIARDCGYDVVETVENFESLDKALGTAKTSDKLTFIEAKTTIGARSDLGRPTTTPIQNRDAFMKMLGN